MINVQIEKSNNENSLSLLRRFNKRIQGAGVLNKMRSVRYKERNKSKYTRKKRALTQMGRRAEMAELIKLGKVTEKMPRR